MYHKSIVMLCTESFAKWQLYYIDLRPFLIFHCWWQTENGRSYCIL